MMTNDDRKGQICDREGQIFYPTLKRILDSFHTVFTPLGFHIKTEITELESLEIKN